MQRTVFSTRQVRTLNTLAQRLLAPHEPEAFDPASIDLGGEMSEYVSDMSLAFRIGMRLMVTAFEWLPLFVLGRAKRFTRLNDGEQVLYIARWAEAHSYPMRMMFTSLKMLLSLLFYEHAEPLAETEWPLLDPADCKEPLR